MKQLMLAILTFALFLNIPLYAQDHGHEHKEQAGGHNNHGDNTHDDMSIDTMEMEMPKEHAEHGDEHGDEHGGHEEGGEPIKLSPAQIKQAGITTLVLQHQAEKKSVTAPGNVSFNAYNITDVTAVVDGVVNARHVRLGDKVKRGQRLVTLTSSVLAQAQADYLRVEAVYHTSKLDLKRLQGLVKDQIVSQARFQQVQSGHQAAFANLAAAKATLSSYGMNKKEIKGLAKEKHYGRLVLRASRSGTITADNFRLGQHIAAGTRLLQIVDESTVWVEVKLAQSQVEHLYIGQAAMVFNRKQDKYQANVVNIHHQLDVITRTVGVRLEVKNPKDSLRPGMFVRAEIAAGDGDEVLLLPEDAVQRQGNELIVFVEEEAGHFERREVEVGKTSLGFVSILKGVEEGEAVVITGAFTLASELAKSGFAVHNH